MCVIFCVKNLELFVFVSGLIKFKFLTNLNIFSWVLTKKDYFIKYTKKIKNI